MLPNLKFYIYSFQFNKIGCHKQRALHDPDSTSGLLLVSDCRLSARFFQLSSTKSCLNSIKKISPQDLVPHFSWPSRQVCFNLLGIRGSSNGGDFLSLLGQQRTLHQPSDMLLWDREKQQQCFICVVMLTLMENWVYTGIWRKLQKQVSCGIVEHSQVGAYTQNYQHSQINLRTQPKNKCIHQSFQLMISGSFKELNHVTITDGPGLDQPRQTAHPQPHTGQKPLISAFIRYTLAKS